jgi:hypothetical protein
MSASLPQADKAPRQPTLPRKSESVLRFRGDLVRWRVRRTKHFRAGNGPQMGVVPGLFRKHQRAILGVANAPMRVARAHRRTDPTATLPHVGAASPTPVPIDPQCTFDRCGRHHFGERRGRRIGHRQIFARGLTNWFWLGHAATARDTREQQQAEREAQQRNHRALAKHELRQLARSLQHRAGAYGATDAGVG